MPRQRCTTVYKFDELSDEAKEQARAWYRGHALDYQWYDGTFDDAQECLKLAGFKVERIFFSGFSSQGDGACFEGTWCAESAQPVKAMKQHAPKDKRLHAIAAAARDIAKQDGTAYARIKHRGHYYHEYETAFDFDTEKPGDNDTVDAAIVEVARDAMRWIYRRLEEQHDWLLADEQVDENIRINGHEFLESGE
jgi:hypothetical protein